MSFRGIGFFFRLCIDVMRPRLFHSLFFVSLGLHQFLHIPCNLAIRDLSIDLCAGDGGVSHHLGNALYRNTCLQGQRAEAVATDVVAQRNTNATRQAHGFKMGK